MNIILVVKISNVSCRKASTKKSGLVLWGDTLENYLYQVHDDSAKQYAP